MASSSFTPNIGLCSWSETDKPKRIDFVADNLLIDEKLGGHLSDKDIHITQQEKEMFLNPYTVMTYAGNGESERSFDVSSEYSFVLVFQKFRPAVTMDSDGNYVSHFTFAGRLFGSSGDVTLTSSSLIVTQDGSATNGRKNNFNEDKGQYVAILFR